MAHTRLCGLQAAVKALDAEVAATTSELTKLRADLEAHKGTLERCHRDLKAVTQEKRALEGRISEGDVRTKKLEHSLAKLQRDAEDVTRKTDSIVKVRCPQHACVYRWLALL